MTSLFCLFFFNDTATTEIYTLSLHDALPIYLGVFRSRGGSSRGGAEYRRGAHPAPDSRRERAHGRPRRPSTAVRDRKSTRLNSSHANISYAVFCLKKKKTTYG